MDVTDDSHGLNSSNEFTENDITEFFPPQFSSFKHTVHFHLITFIQKFPRLFYPCGEIVIAYEGSNSHLFDTDVFLGFFTLPFLLGFLVFEFFIINELGDRRVSVSCNLNDVDPEFFSLLKRFNFGNNTYLFAVLRQQTNLGARDLIVNAVIVFLWRLHSEIDYL